MTGLARTLWAAVSVLLALASLAPIAVAMALLAGSRWAHRRAKP